MDSEQLKQELQDHFAQLPPDDAEAKPANPQAFRALMLALAQVENVPPGTESLVQRLLFQQYPWLVDNLPPPELARLDRLLDHLSIPTGGSEPPAGSEERVFKVIQAAAQQQLAATRPAPRSFFRGFRWALPFATAMAAVCLVIRFNATEPRQGGPTDVHSSRSSSSATDTSGDELQPLWPFRGLVSRGISPGPPAMVLAPIFGSSDPADRTYHAGETARLTLSTASASYLYLVEISEKASPKVRHSGSKVAQGRTFTVVQPLPAPGTVTLIAVTASRPIPTLGNLGQGNAPLTVKAAGTEIARLAAAQGVAIETASISLQVAP